MNLINILKPFINNGKLHFQKAKKIGYNNILNEMKNVFINETRLGVESPLGFLLFPTVCYRF